jgi:hypothetical protein
MKQQTNKHRHYRARTKLKAIAMKGGQCQRCGFDDERALRFCHRVPLRRGRNGLRKTARASTSSHLAVLRGAKGLALLCANCSCIATAQDASINVNIKRTTTRRRAATR